MIILDQLPSAATPFVAYSYSYPHKTAYRALDPVAPLKSVWEPEDRSALFLYLHVPFCEYRCGFCNLFTLTTSSDDLPRAYLGQLRRQATQVKQALGACGFARVAIGGGTPTFLDAAGLAELLDIATTVMGADLQAVPVSCEASPATVTAEKLRLLRGAGIDRLSLGVQSFDDRESQQLGRPQKSHDAVRAIEAVRKAGFAVLNLDLIYGTPGQSLASWEKSVTRTLSFMPEEIYLYPLYIRELTGLGRKEAEPDDGRVAAYRLARTLLGEAGYEQVSLRMFRLRGSADCDGPVYCCQSDGMVGLGCGARSYTQRLHYSSEYAVGRQGVRAILEDYLQRPPTSFDAADYGYWLDDEDRQRRYLILSLLSREGIDLARYESLFGNVALQKFRELGYLLRQGWASLEDGILELTDSGIEMSDAIGPWLYSRRVKERMKGYECR